MAGSIAMSVMTHFGLKNGMSKEFKRMGKSATTFGTTLKAILSAGLIQRGFGAITNGVKSFITEASKVEDATAAFTPLMGGVEKATKLVERLNKEAATTPFQFEGISSIAKQLLPAMNGNIEKTADTFRMLGDTAGGNIQKLESITKGYTKALLKGKPDMEALNMIADAGVPIFSEMSKSMGIAQEQLFVLSRQGKLTKKDLEKAFQTMTKEGGIFYKGMEISSLTFSGRMSTLRDHISQTAGLIGSTFMDVLKGGVSELGKIAFKVREWVTVNKELIKTKIDKFVNNLRGAFQKLKPYIDRIFKVIKPLVYAVFTLGKTLWDLGVSVFKVLEDLGVLNFLFGVFEGIAAFVTSGIRGISKAIEFLSPVLKYLIPIFAALIAKQVIWNFLMTANPIGVFIAAIAALVLAIGVLIDNWDTVVAGFEYVAGVVAGAVMAALEGIGNFFGFLGEKVMQVVGFFGLLASIVIDKVVGAFEFLWSIVEPIIKGIGDFVNAVGDFFGGAIGGIGDFFSGIGQGIGDLFTGGGKEEAPNRREVEARQAIQFNGNLNISGAPAGSSFNGITTGAPPIRIEMLGVS